MADRTFHKRFTLTARIGVAVFAILALYFFWVKLAIIGIFVAIIIVGMIERILNTTYTFKMVKPIDLRRWNISSSMRAGSLPTEMCRYVMSLMYTSPRLSSD